MIYREFSLELLTRKCEDTCWFNSCRIASLLHPKRQYDDAPAPGTIGPFGVPI